MGNRLPTWARHWSAAYNALPLSKVMFVFSLMADRRLSVDQIDH